MAGELRWVKVIRTECIAFRKQKRPRMWLRERDLVVVDLEFCNLNLDIYCAANNR